MDLRGLKDSFEGIELIIISKRILPDKRIKGGYYIKARCIEESEIAFAPPHVREIWDWLMRQCNHKDRKSGGKVIHRGQCVRMYRDIQDGLHWMVGWRKETYSKWACEIAVKWLKKRGMITTRKTTRGMLITIVNYDYYQNPKNYEAGLESHRRTTGKPQSTDTINKNDKNKKNENKSGNICHIIPPSLEMIEVRFREMEYPEKEAEAFYDYYESNGWRVGKNSMRNWYSAAANWNRNLKKYGKDNKTSYRKGYKGFNPDKYGLGK